MALEAFKRLYVGLRGYEKSVNHMEASDISASDQYFVLLSGVIKTKKPNL